MGLDMYAYTIKEELIGDAQIEINVLDAIRQHYGIDAITSYEHQDEIRNKAKNENLFNPDFKYWRKFNHLHGWMEKLYYKKGGTETFDCIAIKITSEDLDQLEKDMDSLKPTPGFFFGSYEDLDADDKEEIIEFIKDSREAIKDGYAVIYDSWW